MGHGRIDLQMAHLNLKRIFNYAKPKRESVTRFCGLTQGNRLVSSHVLCIDGCYRSWTIPESSTRRTFLTRSNIAPVVLETWWFSFCCGHLCRCCLQQGCCRNKLCLYCEWFSHYISTCLLEDWAPAVKRVTATEPSQHQYRQPQETTIITHLLWCVHTGCKWRE